MNLAQSIREKLFYNTYPTYKIKLSHDDDISDGNAINVYGKKSAFKIATNRPLIVSWSWDGWDDEDAYEESNIIEFILLNNNVKLLGNIISVWLPNADKRLTVDVQLNLLHYMLYSLDELELRLTPEERNYITTISLNDLKDLLGPNYNNFKPVDEASMLFAALSGRSAPLPNIQNNVEQYKRISSLKFSDIYTLKVKVYDISYSGKLPLLVRLALNPESQIAHLYLTVNADNVDKYLEEYGIIIPNNTINIQLKDKIKTFRENIVEYGTVLTRPINLTLPSPLELLEDDNIKETLWQFTNAELYDGYYNDNLERVYHRSSLIYTIITNIKNIRWWVDKNAQCKNNDNINISTGVPRRDDNKIIEDGDIILSYGTYYYYFCYKLSELMDSFRRDGENYIFTNPDYNPSIIQNTPLGLIEPEFNIKTLKNLLKTLEDNNYDREFPYFYNFLRDGIEYKTRPIPYTEFIDRQISECAKMSINSQQQITQYLAWIFYYSMYMRFWKGPGNPYPIKDLNRKGEGNVCLPTVRDEHIFIQQGLLHRMKMSFDENTLKWISNIYLVEYNFANKLFVVDGRLLTGLLDNVQYGILCMGVAADELMATSYYYLTKMYDDDINNIVNPILPRLITLEIQTIDIILSDVQNMIVETPEDLEDKDHKITVLTQQLNNLKLFQDEPVDQEPFTLDNIRPNIHI